MHNVILVKGPQGMNDMARNLQAVISGELGPVLLALEELGQCSLQPCVRSHAKLGTGSMEEGTNRGAIRNSPRPVR